MAAYVLEWTLHHLDLIAHLPHASPPPAEGLAASRQILETILGAPLPASFSDTDAVVVGTGRRASTQAEKGALGDLGKRLPLFLS